MKELKYQFYIGGTPAQVWDSLVSPDKVQQIYYGSTIHSSFTAGEPLKYIGPGADGPDTLHVYGTVLEFSLEQAFRFTHKVGPSYLKSGEPHESRISWLLEPVGGCTKLTLIHDQWQPDDPSYGPSESSWWQILSNIKTLVETGSTLDFGSWE